MGMSSTQSRLLCLTARLHDIECKAQMLQSQEVSLATEQDAAFKRYNDALDAKKVQIGFNNDESAKVSYVDATYETACEFNPNRKMQYALISNISGNVLTTQQVVNAWNDYGNDKYAFAWAMFGLDGGWAADGMQLMNQEIGIGTSAQNWDDYPYGTSNEDGNMNNLYMSQAEAVVFERHRNDTPGTLSSLYDNLIQLEQNGGTEAELKEALNAFRTHLYNQFGGEIFEQMAINKQGGTSDNPDSELDITENWSQIEQKFNYYLNLWEIINECGGCEAIDESSQSGEEGANWFNNMTESGIASIKVFNTGNNHWDTTSVNSGYATNYMKSTQNDKDLKLAEAIYEHDLEVINRKETKLTRELKELETERTAITNEMDSDKKVIQDNIDRNFKIFG